MFYYAYEDMGGLEGHPSSVPRKELFKSEVALSIKELQEHIVKAEQTRLLPRWVGFWGETPNASLVPLGQVRDIAPSFETMLKDTLDELYDSSSCLRKPKEHHMAYCAGVIITWAKRMGISLQYNNTSSVRGPMGPRTGVDQHIITLDFFNLKILFQESVYLGRVVLYFRVEIADVRLCFTHTLSVSRNKCLEEVQEKTSDILRELETRFLLTALSNKNLSIDNRERSECYKTIHRELAGDYTRAVEWMACPPSRDTWGKDTPLLYKALADELLQNNRSTINV